MALREKLLALNHLLAGVAEKFRGLHLERVVGDYHMRPPPDEGPRARIEELVRLIERMGSVNLDAMREHAEAEERYTFYTTQKADLDKALDDLDAAIAADEPRVEAALRGDLRRGQREVPGDLPADVPRRRAPAPRSTNPEDMLETGIEIFAQPPGKKLCEHRAHVRRREGAHRSGLIFAIFQIKPSPFCILDEVDAPLDEANVARYNEMIRAMTDRSQFILITHIKRTMQMVDVLYGVTMQEPRRVAAGEREGRTARRRRRCPKRRPPRSRDARLIA